MNDISEYVVGFDPDLQRLVHYYDQGDDEYDVLKFQWWKFYGDKDRDMD